MEEKRLYFEPEFSGDKKHKKEKSKKKEHKFLKLFLFLLFLIIIVLIIIWLLRGNKTISGQYPENLKSESLECLSDDKTYERIHYYENPKEKELKIVATFYGTEKLSSINLRYSLYFNTNQEAVNAEAVAHATLNTNLQQTGHSPETFHNKFTILNNKLEVSLFANRSDIDDFSKSYFLISQDKTLPETLDEYRKQYESQGFICNASIDKK